MSLSIGRRVRIRVKVWTVILAMCSSVLAGTLISPASADGTNVTGRIVGAEGEAIGSIWVNAYRFRRGSHEWSPAGGTFTDSNGDWGLSLASGTYVFRVSMTPTLANAEGYYSTFVGSPQTYNPLLLPQGDMLVQLGGTPATGVAASGKVTVRTTDLRLGATRLRRGGPISGRVLCKGAGSKTYMTITPQVGEYLVVRPKSDGTFKTGPMPVGTSVMSGSVPACKSGRNTGDFEYHVKVQSQSVSNVSVGGGPRKPSKAPRFAPKARPGKKIKVRFGTWPAGTRQSLLPFDEIATPSRDWDCQFYFNLKFKRANKARTPAKLKPVTVPKRCARRVLRGAVLSSENGRYTGVFKFKTKVARR